MFERFTDRARAVLALAQEEARLLNHGFIGTEHILLGLLREGDGVGGQALASLGLSLDAVHNGVREIVGASSSIPSGTPQFTPRAKKVLELSLREALQLGHSYIGTEHIVLGITREGNGVAVQVLANLGVDVGLVRQRVIGLMSGDPGQDRGGAPMKVTSVAPNSEPRCPQCRAPLAEAARFRTIVVPPDSTDNQVDAISTWVVYCIQCGMALHVFKSDPSG